MKSEQERTQNGQHFAVENQNKETSFDQNNQLIEREPIDGTPFYCVGNLETGFFIALGKYRLTEPKPSVYECMKQLQDNQWHIIMNLIITIQSTIEEVKSSNNTNGNTIV